jgi:hypothetical protein
MKKIATILAALIVLVTQLTKAQTFNKDVASIMFAKCTSCHNPNGANSQMPFTEYSKITPYSNSIYSNVNAGLMPPWPPDTTYTKFLHQHENTLTLAEKNTILNWITNKTPEGNGVAPPLPTYLASNKLAGKADLVVGTGLVASNANTSTDPSATNSNPYNCYVIPLDLKEDRWLRAAEVVPGNLSVVHHCVVTIDTTGAAVSDVKGSCASQPGQFGIIGWSSGAAPVIYPNKAPLKVGQRIPKGSSIVIQMHYAPGSGGGLDSTKVRLYFYNKDSLAGLRPVYDQVALQYWGISLPLVTIPANSGQWFTANTGDIAPCSSCPLKVGANPCPPANTDISIIAVNPHSHVVCTKVLDYAFKSADTIPLIRINRWSYHWQGYYYYPKPVKIPAGYKIQAKHFFDNRTSNLELITDPSKPVNFGTKTSDEMLFDDITWMTYKAGDENIDLAAISAADTIFTNGLKPKPYEKAKFVVTERTVGIESYTDILNQMIVSPNPATDKIAISIGKPSVYIGRIFNITGQTVLNTETFTDKLTIDLQHIPVGLYILEVIDLKNNNRITKKIIKSN